MDPVWIGVAIALVSGAVGIVFGALGRRDAKAANKLAANANTLSAKTATLADESNTVARDANRLSEEANSLVKRTVSRDEEISYVEWVAEWNAPSAILILRHRGRDTAFRTSAVVYGEDIHQLEALGDVSNGTDATMQLPKLLDLRTQYDNENATSVQAMHMAGIAYFPSSFHPDVTVTILWTTELGTPRQQQIQMQLS